MSEAGGRSRSRRPSVLATLLAAQPEPALTLGVFAIVEGSLFRSQCFLREGMIMKPAQNTYPQIKAPIRKVPSGHLGEAVLGVGFAALAGAS